MALVGFAMLLLEFVLSGRFRQISRAAGIDTIMRFHQRIALPIAILLLLHPFLYVTPWGHPLPWDSSGQHRLGARGGPVATGIAAWLIFSVLIVMAIWRDKAPYRYEIWRSSHGMGAALVTGLGMHHAIAAGRYSSHASLAAFWHSGPADHLREVQLRVRCHAVQTNRHGDVGCDRDLWRRYHGIRAALKPIGRLIQQTGASLVTFKAPCATRSRRSGLSGRFSARQAEVGLPGMTTSCRLRPSLHDFVCQTVKDEQR